MEVKIPEQLYKPLKKVIRLQNVELLKLISFEEGWDFKELKKKYIKDTEVYELVKKYDKKQKKKIKKIKIKNQNPKKKRPKLNKFPKLKKKNYLMPIVLQH